MSPQPLLSRQPLPGYTLLERIGSGGYGEVWRAEAPGGLNKAVKLVFGSFTESRANRERKSIDRIKEVRHPFLLSIERIEVIDNQLVIVTELADCSLKDRFTECKSLGLPGIPRDELLGYMRDAADALDFMLERHSLQHLDIKPENLLLLSNRVKVADFGLVKDLHEASVSILDGMTPLYSPPELFDGRPTHRSDQYSLAVVYLEMLTGQLPFNASTAAQLAAMHILPGYKPNVLGLPESDREPILRALARDAKARFSSCRELVDRLSGLERPTFVPGTASPTNEQWPRGTVSPTEIFGQNADSTSVENLGSQTDILTPPVSDVAVTSTTRANSWATRSHALGEVTPLAHLDWNPAAWKPRPTLVIGVGGTAGRVIRSLRQRMTFAFGAPAQAPALATLLLDSDSDALHAATSSWVVGASGADETLCLRLRSTNDYREQSNSLLQWISRRWLYNIPRRPQTQGLRPLGRLALVDNCKAWQKRVSEALERIQSSDAIQRSRKSIGRSIDPSPRVVIVASISGGVGSGSVVDIALAARQMLKKMGVERFQICGVLAHSSAGGVESQELSVASARATLHEICHFATSPNGHPGDKAMGLEPTAPPAQLFDELYYLHLGNQLSEFELDRAADAVGEYLFRDIATEMGQLLATIRTATPAVQPAEGDLFLRTCKVLRLGGLPADAMELVARRIAEQIAKEWFDSAAPSGPAAQSPKPEREACREYSDQSQLFDELYPVVQTVFGGKASQDFCRRFAGWLAKQNLSLASQSDQLTARRSQSDATAIERALADVTARLMELRSGQPSGDGEMPAPELDAVQRAIQDNLPRISADATGRFWELMESAPQQIDDIPNLLLAAAYQTAVRAISGDAVLTGFVEKLGEARVAVESIRQFFQLALPTALATGGAKRTVLIAPRGADHATLIELVRRVLGENLLVVEGNGNDLLLVCEGEQVSLRRCADQLVDGRQVYVDAAYRLLTRIDIHWQKMPLLS